MDMFDNQNIPALSSFEQEEQPQQPPLLYVGKDSEQGRWGAGLGSPRSGFGIRVCCKNTFFLMNNKNKMNQTPL